MTSSFQNPQHEEKLLVNVGGAFLVEKWEARAIDLASHLLSETKKKMRGHALRHQGEMFRLMGDFMGKHFIMATVDQCFRSRHPIKVFDHLHYLIRLFGPPKSLSPWRYFQFLLFKGLGARGVNTCLPLLRNSLRKLLFPLIRFGSEREIQKLLKKTHREGGIVSLCRLGGEVVGESGVDIRMKQYEEDLKNPFIQRTIVPISTLYSRSHSCPCDCALEKIVTRLSTLYRIADRYSKMVFIDVERYRDLFLAKEVFKKTLDTPECHSCRAGIVLPAHFPESYIIQREITQWAMARKRRGGKEVMIRLVKGENQSLERCDASLHHWPQPCISHQVENDANYKRMLLYGTLPQHVESVHLSVATHNLFDLAFATVVCEELHITSFVSFEVSEGLTSYVERLVQTWKKSQVTILYSVISTEKFSHVIPHLMRRFCEWTHEKYFVSSPSHLSVRSGVWKEQASLFSQSCCQIERYREDFRSLQDRWEEPQHLKETDPFENEPDTCFFLPHHQTWVESTLRRRKENETVTIPLVIGGQEIFHPLHEGRGVDPADPEKQAYTYTVALSEDKELAVTVAKKYESDWASLPLSSRLQRLINVCRELRLARSHLIEKMVTDCGKPVQEADLEISDAIDLGEFYWRSMRQLAHYQDICWTPKGTLLVLSSWDFPLSTPAGSLFSALVTGNCVIFSPAVEVILIGWELAKIFWKGGVPKEALQFVVDADRVEWVGDPRLNGAFFSGPRAIAKQILNHRPDLDLLAETGGKNSMIITAMADQTLAIKDLVHSAFSYNGQKCSSVSLAIVEGEVYDDLHFRNQLIDAVKSLKVGPARGLASEITPLLRSPSPDLYRGLTQLDPGESWLLRPKQVEGFSNLWTPGIRWDVKKGGFAHLTELFAPVLGVMRADDLEHAIRLANATPYGLTAGLHSLDQREQEKWHRSMSSGNYYVNRPSVGAKVQRQPFGGCKSSHVGFIAKTGGDHYLVQLMHAQQVDMPKEKFPVSDWVNRLTRSFEKITLSAEHLGIWYASTASYAFFWNQLKRNRDHAKLIGEDNFVYSLPCKKMVFRIDARDQPIDFLRVFAAALTVEAKIEVSWTRETAQRFKQIDWASLLPLFTLKEEEEAVFIKRVRAGHFRRVRVLHTPSDELMRGAAHSLCFIARAPVLMNGRIELLHYLVETSLSIRYQRYGNLGLREGELRKPLAVRERRGSA